MPLSADDRNKFQIGLLALCYLRAEGEAGANVDGEEIRKELGLDPLGFEHIVVDLQERGWLIWGGGGTLEFEMVGIRIFEELLRRELVELGSERVKSSVLIRQHALWQELEWQRYQVWRAIYDAGGAHAGQHVGGYDLPKQLGMSGGEYGRALSMLEFKGVAKVVGAPFVTTLTTSGRDQMVAMFEEFKKHRLKTPKRAAYLKFLLARWQWEAGATAPTIEDNDGFRHSDDYLSVSIRGETFTLTPRIATVIRSLHRAHRAGTPDVTFERIRAEPGFEGYEKLRDIFKPRHLEAFEALIRSSGRGLYRLNV